MDYTYISEYDSDFYKLMNNFKSNSPQTKKKTSHSIESSFTRAMFTKRIQSVKKRVRIAFWIMNGKEVEDNSTEAET